MSYADKLFIDMCNNILENGTDTKGEKVRPHWADGTPAYTQKLFCVVNFCTVYKLLPFGYYMFSVYYAIMKF